MPFSNSAITNYGKVIMPSVEGWGRNMNIIRDPPKSITTRRKNKVGQTSSVTEMIDQSENRNSESIRVYARGVNPSVSVSYDNNGNNGGGGGLAGLNNSISGIGYGSAPKLRHRVSEVFRPKVRLQRDLLPLSRLPRLITSANTLPGFADYSKKAWTASCASKTREVKTTTIQACVRPTSRYIIQTPIKEPSNTITHIKTSSINVAANSGKKTRAVTDKHVGDVKVGINKFPLYANAKTTKIKPYYQTNSSIKYIQNNIQDTSKKSTTTNLSTQMFYSNIEDVLDIQIPVQDIKTTECSAPVSGHNKTEYIHDTILLNRNVPVHDFTVNTSDSHKYVNAHENSYIVKLENKSPTTYIEPTVKIKRTEDTNSREAYLAPRTKRGGFQNRENKPMIGRMQNVKEPFSTEKSKITKAVSETMQGRFNNLSRRK